VTLETQMVTLETQMVTLETLVEEVTQQQQIQQEVTQMVTLETLVEEVTQMVTQEVLMAAEEVNLTEEVQTITIQKVPVEKAMHKAALPFHDLQKITFITLKPL
jgi:hypothetical protein